MVLTRLAGALKGVAQRPALKPARVLWHRLGRKGRIGLAAAVVAALAVIALLPPPPVPVAVAERVPCLDSDQGSLPTVRGTCADRENFTDTCLTGQTLLEYACADESCVVQRVDCHTLGKVCSAGACNGTYAPPVVNLTPELPKVPDLTVQSVWARVFNETKTNTTVNTSGNISYSVTFRIVATVLVSVRNIGGAPAYPSKLNLSMRGRTVEDKVVDTPIILPGEMGSAVANFTLDGAGNYLVLADADILHEIEEISEGNNRGAGNFSVS
ncbi:MAG: hypothetical protein HY520_03095 [Candidatus Aenigmarchaeota archaeon]|nr:hypothetical protein [Candidatus Aenigmarchaeota archaeon]